MGITNALCFESDACVNGCVKKVYLYTHIMILPLLQLRLSFPNTNPAWQAHTCHSFLLIQIWLHPPLFSLSQGCTKICKKRGSKYVASDKKLYSTTPQNMFILTNLFYKTFHLRLLQIQLHKSIHAFHFSCYKFGSNHHCLLRHRDALKMGYC